MFLTSPSLPTQEATDIPSNQVGYGPGWGNSAGGVAARPYVVSLSVINDGVSTPVIMNGTTTPAPMVPGGVTTVVSPINLCKTGQTPAFGVCYATPNRVALTVGYGSNGNVGVDFSSSNSPVTPTVDANSVIDMTVALNTLGKSLRWTWINGELLYWQASNLGQDNATVHVKFRPAMEPTLANVSESDFGCTASPPTNCRIASANGQVLSAQLVFSLDESLDPALTGSAFATQNAFLGYLTPGGTAQAPSLDVELASTHTKADGTPQLGTIEAFIPSAALVNLYGVLPTDSTAAFTTTRLGDPGTNEPPSYTPWTTEANGSEGLLITVKGITFSAPKYHISSRLKHVAVHANARGARTTITAVIAGCSKKRRCLGAVYDLGRRSAARLVARKRTVLSNRVVTAKTLSIAVPASKLHKGDRYLLVVHSARHMKLLASSTGIVV
jgi:hypothetical protein